MTTPQPQKPDIRDIINLKYEELKKQAYNYVEETLLENAEIPTKYFEIRALLELKLINNINPEPHENTINTTRINIENTKIEVFYISDEYEVFGKITLPNNTTLPNQTNTTKQTRQKHPPKTQGNNRKNKKRIRQINRNNNNKSERKGMRRTTKH